ncbi:MAG TPA: class I SAM-dependent methyltransferase [Acidimicrobiia bacterium]|nr:class I SAM-dependent methyltransferase [Acidimicrobiia bacterium]
MIATPPRIARALFAPLAPGYERWARILSMGQDGRWRARMVQAIAPRPGDTALDIAAGTGSITRLLQQKGASVISLDQSAPMLAPAVARGATGVLASAESLPFPDARFDIVTFGYLLRYVGDVGECMTEISNALKPGGRVGMVEFGRPSGIWRPLWWLYTRLVLPGAGLLAGEGWPEVGRFLGPNIEEFADRYPPEQLSAIWEEAGLSNVRFDRLSLGGGLVMWADKPERSRVKGS